MRRAKVADAHNDFFPDSLALVKQPRKETAREENSTRLRTSPVALQKSRTVQAIALAHPSGIAAEKKIAGNVPVTRAAAS
jgi:hypothetical protein